MTENLLFSTGRLSDYLQSCTETLRSQIQNFPENEITSPNFELQISQLVSRNIIKIPVLNEEGIEYKEETIEVPNDPYLNLGMASTRKAMKINFYVPFSGESAIFNFQPREFTLNFPRGTIKNKEIVLEYIVSHSMTEENIKNAYLQEISKIKEWIGKAEKQIGEYNNAIPVVVNEAVAYKRAKIEESKKRAANFGTKRRD